MLLKLIIFVISLQVSFSSNPRDEPPIYGPEHKFRFSRAIKNIHDIYHQMVNPTVVMDGQYSTVCGSGKVPLGKFDIGFDPKYPDPKESRKTYIGATIRPEHLNTGIDALVPTRTWARDHSIRRSNDQAGHLIAKSLGGYGRKCNIIPQDGQINNSAWKKKETIAYNFLLDGVQKDGDGKPVKDPNGKFIAVENRLLFARIALAYDRDGELDSNGDLYPKDRPSSIYYLFAMCKDENDKNPLILAGFFVNRSYLKEYLFRTSDGQTNWKDEPDFSNVPLPLNELNVGNDKTIHTQVPHICNF